MIALYAIVTFVVCFAAVMIAAEIGLDSLSLLRHWARER